MFSMNSVMSEELFRLEFLTANGIKSNQRLCQNFLNLWKRFSYLKSNLHIGFFPLKVRCKTVLITYIHLFVCTDRQMDKIPFAILSY